MADFDYAELNREERGEQLATTLLLWTLRITVPAMVCLLSTGGVA